MKYFSNSTRSETLPINPYGDKRKVTTRKIVNDNIVEEEYFMIKVKIRDCLDETDLEDKYPIIWVLYDTLKIEGNECELRNLKFSLENGSVFNSKCFIEPATVVNIDFMQDYIRLYTKTRDCCIYYDSIMCYWIRWE